MPVTPDCFSDFPELPSVLLGFNFEWASPPPSCFLCCRLPTYSFSHLLLLAPPILPPLIYSPRDPFKGVSTHHP